MSFFMLFFFFVTGVVLANASLDIALHDTSNLFLFEHNYISVMKKKNLTISRNYSYLESTSWFYTYSSLETAR